MRLTELKEIKMKQMNMKDISKRKQLNMKSGKDKKDLKLPNWKLS